MRALKLVVIGALAAQALTPVAAAAQPRGDRYATQACLDAIQGEVRDRYPQAGAIRFVTREPTRVSDVETQVQGKGEFDDRNGGAARFAYGCTYNNRTNRTFALDVRDVRPVPGSTGKKDNSAAIAGLVLGAIIVGALVASSDKGKDNDKDRDRDRDRDRRDDSWSPADGVRCSRRDAACYEDGSYSDRWTRRVFVR
ncbi:hypothetical protein [Phenylobacterium sp.]|uniref:hypothetical protein n=1 Tax=Phenylobacterium sp. TaxID=1871053 RepID=UPI0025EC1F78|nr:hypothetical protein [Phenylobacterium sp.]